MNLSTSFAVPSAREQGAFCVRRSGESIVCSTNWIRFAAKAVNWRERVVLGSALGLGSYFDGSEVAIPNHSQTSARIHIVPLSRSGGERERESFFQA